jgi:hypothetical protein
MAAVKSPNPEYTGVVVGVEFVDGKGETDDEGALRYFRRQGYDVGEGFPDVSADPPTFPSGAAGQRLLPSPDQPTTLDAADPANDLVPVGGVKSAAAPAAPAPRSSKAKRRAESNTSSEPADITPQQPVAAHDDTQHASSATTATTPSAAPEGDTSANDVTKATPAPNPAAGTTSAAGAPTVVEGTNLGTETAPATSPKSDDPSATGNPVDSSGV